MIALNVLQSSLNLLKNNCATIICAIGISFFCTFYFIPVVIRIARAYGILDAPDGAIKKHKEPVAYLGGVAVFVGFLTSFALVYSFQSCHHVLPLLIGCTLLLFLGLVDDLLVLQPAMKFLGQCVATFCFVKAGLYLRVDFFHAIWSVPLSLLWTLTVVNAFNLVDIMDGLASTVAIGAALNFMIFGYLAGSIQVVVLLACFVGALLAFLWYNRPPASIYLGDAGSLCIGGMLAGVPFLIKWGEYNSFAFLIPLLLLSIPLGEIMSLIIIRTYKGIPFYRGSPHHFAHFLQSNGWSKKGILYFVTLLGLLQGGTSLLFYYQALNVTQLFILETLYVSGILAAMISHF